MVTGSLADALLVPGAVVDLVLPADLFGDVDDADLALSAQLAGGDPLPAWLSFVPAERRLTGTAPTDLAGSLPIEILASDGSLSAITGFAIIANPPVLDSLSTDEDNAVTSAPLYSGGDVSPSYALDLTGTVGSVTLNPDGTVRYDPAGQYEGLGEGGSGVDSFSVEVTADGATTTHRFTVTIDGVNDAPVLQHAPEDRIIEEEGSLFVQLPSDMFVDPEGQPLTYTASLNSGELPYWIHFDPVALTIQASPPTDYSGYVLIKITVSDGTISVSDAFRLDITETPDPVTAIILNTDVIVQHAAHGTPVGRLSSVDPDVGDTHSYTLLDDSKGQFAIVDDQLVVVGELDPNQGGTSRTVTVRATDGQGHSFDQELTVRLITPEQQLQDIAGPGTRSLHVTTTGDDLTADGTIEHPYGTIQAAINAATAGTDILVHAGTYAESVDLVTNGTTDAPIRLISADGQGQAIIQPVAKSGVNAMDARGASNWVIDGMTFQGSDTIGTYGVLMVSRNSGMTAAFQEGYGAVPVENILFKNNSFVDWGIDSIHIGQGFNIGIIDNVFDGAHEQAVDLLNVDRAVIAGNSFDNITAKPEWRGLDGAQYLGDSAITIKGDSSYALIADNVIGHTDGPAIKVGSPTNIVFVPVSNESGVPASLAPQEASHVVVSGNTALDHPIGLFIQAANDVLVKENYLTQIQIFDLNRTFSTAFYGAGEQFLPGAMVSRSDDIYIENNVFTNPTFFVKPSTTTLYDIGGNVLGDANTPLPPAIILTDVIYGKSGSAQFSADDVLYGDRNGPSNDYIDGRVGADLTIGGMGDDVYAVDNKDDMVHEFDGEGNDTIIVAASLVTYHMADVGSAPGAYFVENGVISRTSGATLYGNILNNTLIGNDGADFLYGKDGDDSMYGNAGNDWLSGGNGADNLFGGAGTDRLIGNDGNDNIDGGIGKDELRGLNGDDYIVSVDADSFIDGGNGIDTIYLNRSGAAFSMVFDILSPSEITLADATRLFNFEILFFSGGSGNDVVSGGNADDQLAGNGGDDQLFGLDGKDILYGGEGNDYIYGGAGNDTLDGSLGIDNIYGGDGNDLITTFDAEGMLNGGTGTDTVTILRGYEFVGATLDFTNVATQVVTLLDGTEVTGFEVVNYTAGTADDIITGSTGADRVTGGKGNDTLYGGVGNDNLAGGQGDDSIYGGNGSDKVTGDAGMDQMWGGQGGDTFQFVKGQIEGDTIWDLGAGDKLDFGGFGLGATLTYSGADYVWIISTADASYSEHLTLFGVTTLDPGSYTL